MKLEEQVVNLKLSKRLKKLGYPQESLWYWQYNGKEGVRLGIGRYKLVARDTSFGISKRDSSAPTVAELGRVLPYRIRPVNDEDYWLYMSLGRYGDFNIAYDTPSDGMHSRRVYHQEEVDNEANARALMIIYLLESGLLRFWKEEKQ